MNYIETWKKVISEPNEFYREMPTIGGYAAPLTFGIITSFISCILLISIVTLKNSQSNFTKLVPDSIVAVIGACIYLIIYTIFILIATAIIYTLGSFLYLAILHMFFSLLGGTGNYEATFRTLTYSHAFSIFLAISTIPPLFPVIFYIIYIYYVYITALGGMVVHKLSMERSFIAVLVPNLLLLVGYIYLHPIH